MSSSRLMSLLRVPIAALWFAPGWMTCPSYLAPWTLMVAVAFSYEALSCEDWHPDRARFTRAIRYEALFGSATAANRRSMTSPGLDLISLCACTLPSRAGLLACAAVLVQAHPH